MDEAVVILKQNPLIDTASLKIEGGALEWNNIYWNWRDGSLGGGISYDAKTEAKLTRIITLFYKGSYKLKDVIQVYGEPSHIRAHGTDLIDGPGYFYGLEFIWLKQGLLLSFGTQKSPNTFVLNPELVTKTYEGETPLKLVVPGNIDSFNFGNSSYPNTIVPWKGYKPFSYYCLDIHSGKPCPFP